MRLGPRCEGNAVKRGGAVGYGLWRLERTRADVVALNSQKR